MVSILCTLLKIVLTDLPNLGKAPLPQLPHLRKPCYAMLSNSQKLTIGGFNDSGPEMVKISIFGILFEAKFIYNNIQNIFNRFGSSNLNNRDAILTFFPHPIAQKTTYKILKHLLI